MSDGRGRRLLDLLRVPRRVDAQAPLARALTDHARTGRSRTVRVERSGGLRYGLDTASFFELAGEQAPVDDALLAACSGRVLDVGAGAGRHALALEARGRDVCAIDVSSHCVELMRERGVRDARAVDVWSLVAGHPTSLAPARAAGDGAPALGASANGDAPTLGTSGTGDAPELGTSGTGDAPELGTSGTGDAPEVGCFDTILFGMQTIGLTGGVDGLVAMLAGLHRAPQLLAPGGQIVLDSSAPSGPGFVQRVECAPPREADAPLLPEALAGETIVSFAYRGWRGHPFAWVYVGAGALVQLGRECGFDTEILARLDDSPEYAARLTRAAPPVDASEVLAGV